VGAEAVVLEPVALGEPDDVEPVPPPVLAVVGRGEQAVDQPLVGPGSVVADERLGLLGRRRQAEQVERGAPDKRAAVGLGGRAEAVGLEPGQDEGVDRVADPRAVVDRRRLRPGRRAERPEVVLDRGGGGGGGLGLVAADRSGPGRARLDPAAEQLDLLGPERRP
jgi:hypothetical protein